MEDIQDVVVIGGGVKGLNSAYKVQEAARKLGVDIQVTILERNKKVGQEMSRSDHNSAMGHSGQYYGPNESGKMTEKAIYNARGFDLTKEFCREHNILVQQTGKLTVGYSEKSLERLKAYAANAIRNGRDPERVKIISGDEARNIEPLLGEGIMHGLFLEEPYMFDANAINARIEKLILEKDGRILKGTKVKNITRKEDEDLYIVHTNKGNIKARFIINQAGARVHEISKMLGGGKGWGIIPIAGKYMRFKSPTEKTVNVVVYQVPEDENFPFLDPHAMPAEDGYIALGPTAMPTFGALDTKAGMLARIKAHFELEAWLFHFEVLKHHRDFMVRETLSWCSRNHYAKRCMRLFNKEKIDLKGKDLELYKVGIRGQLVEKGKISKRYPIEVTLISKGGREGSVTFMNPGSPGYTASPSIGEAAAARALVALNHATKEQMADIWGFDYSSIEKPRVV